MLSQKRMTIVEVICSLIEHCEPLMSILHLRPRIWHLSLKIDSLYETKVGSLTQTFFQTWAFSYTNN